MSKHPSVHESVTNSIIEELKRNVVPWVRPWNTAVSPFPYNAVSQRQYGRCEHPSSMGRRVDERICQLGVAHVQASARAARARWHREAGRGGDGICLRVESGEARRTTPMRKKRNIPFLKFYSLFNLEQTSGSPERLYRIPRTETIRTTVVPCRGVLGDEQRITMHDECFWTERASLANCPLKVAGACDPDEDRLKSERPEVALVVRPGKARTLIGGIHQFADAHLAQK